MSQNFTQIILYSSFIINKVPVSDNVVCYFSFVNYGKYTENPQKERTIFKNK